MDFVFFPDHFAARAPGYMGNLCVVPSGEWATLIDVANAVQRQEPVSIRPASETELKRADALASLYEIGFTLAEKIETLLDQDAPGVASAKLTSFRDALESVDTGSVELLDRPSECGGYEYGHSYKFQSTHGG